MTTPGEISRIINNLVSQIETKDRIIATQESTIKHQENSIACLRDMVDSANRRANGFPPRNLTPSYAPYNPNKE